MAVKAVTDRHVSIALAYRTFQISGCCYRYERKLVDENAEIAEWLVKLTAAWQGIENAREGGNRLTWGFGLCFLYLRNVKGFGWNHKRVYQIYCELELPLRIRPKKRLKRDKPDTLAHSQSHVVDHCLTGDASIAERGLHGGSTRGWPPDPQPERAG